MLYFSNVEIRSFIYGYCFNYKIYLLSDLAKNSKIIIKGRKIIGGYIMSLRKKTIILFTSVISFICIIIGIVTITNVRNGFEIAINEKIESDNKSSFELLNLKYPGNWSVEDGILYKGSIIINDNNEIVDWLKSLNQDQITIFANDTRVATTVERDGKRAVGTKAADNVINQVLKLNKSYMGNANVLGVNHKAKYIPIKDVNDNTIGMFFVGVSKESAEDLEKLLILCFGFAIVFALIIAVLISNKIISIIKIIIKVTEKIAEGDLTVRINSKRTDEFGQLSNTVDKMTQNTKNIIGNINDATGRLAIETKKISQVSNSLSEGTTQQAGAVEELTSAIGVILEQTKHNGENANKANKLVSIVKDKADKGNVEMSEMLKAMDEIDTATKSIAKFLNVIDDIAFQTNVLALNAAVEAARAGQYGKGFAVVAEEVRALAQKAAEASNKTTDMILLAKDKVEVGNDLANNTAKHLAEIVDAVKDATILIEKINAESQEQIVGIDQINNGIMQVSDVVQESAMNSVETAKEAEVLSLEAKTLHEVATKFKLK